MVCASCGEALPANAKFCLECGTPAAAEPAAEVRKTVTLLFTDVAGSTAMGEALDPEAYRGVMGRYFDVAREAVERHGGTVEKFVGDAVLAVFGVPQAREDDALRAVRAAHELTPALAEISADLQTSHGVALTVRTGVNTGSVVAGTARAGGSFATGDAVNTAARLEQAAGPGEVLLGAETWQLVRDAVEAEPVAVEAKGKAEPVPAYRLLTLHDERAGRSRRLTDPIVGRAAETQILDDALDRVLTSSSSELVTVIGAPGIGKTRLVGELVQRVGDRAEVVSGRCVSYGQGITYFPLVQAIRGALRLTGGESEEVVRHALRDAMTGATDTGQVVDLLLPLLGAAGQPGSHDHTSWAVRRLLEQLARRRPLVVTIDDLHWAEPTLLDLLEQVHAEIADLPLLLVCGARPDLLELRPTWGAGAPTVRLDPFDATDLRARVEAILGGAATDAVATAIAEWSGGNPLFVEEVVAHLVEEQQVRRTDAGWDLAGDLAQVRMPPTLAALLAARLDRLPSSERDLLGRVSIVGLDVTSADAAALGRPESRDALDALARRELLRRVPGPQGDRWAFRHITIRDAAYDALPKALRAELHEQYAAVLDDPAAPAAVDAGVERLVFVAHHLERAVRLRRELAPMDPTLDGRVADTVGTLVRAADEAWHRDDLAATDSLLTRARELRHPTAEGRRDVLLRQLLLDQELNRIGDSPATFEEFELDLGGSATPLDELTLKVGRLAQQLAVGVEIDPAVVIERAEDLERTALDSGDPLRVDLARWALAAAYSMSCSFSDVAAMTERMRTDTTPMAARFSWMWRGPVATYGEVPFSEAGRYPGLVAVTPPERQWQAVFDALAAAATDPEGAQPAIDLVHALNVEPDDAVLALNLGVIHQLRGDLVAALEEYDRAVGLLVESGELAVAATYVGFAACMRLDLGRPDAEVRAELERVVPWSSPYDASSTGLLRQAWCVLETRAGRLDEAQEHADRALAAVDGSQQSWNRADVRLRTSELARTIGDTETERRLLTEARDIYRRKEVVHWAGRCEARLAELV